MRAPGCSPAPAPLLPHSALSFSSSSPPSRSHPDTFLLRLQVHRVLLGNKTDLPDQRQIQPEQGEAMAREFGIKFFETSAKTGQNVEEGG